MLAGAETNASSGSDGLLTDGILDERLWSVGIPGTERRHVHPRQYVGSPCADMAAFSGRCRVVVYRDGERSQASSGGLK